MSISSTFSGPLRLSITLVALAFAACSSGSTDDEPSDGSGQHIDDGGSGSGGTGPGEDPEPGVAGEGANTGVAGTPTEPVEGGDGGTGGDPVEEPVGTAGSDDPGPEPEPEPSEAFLRGEKLVEENGCVTCHQANFAGFTVFPNITPDEATGIGSWSDEQIVAAIRDGVDADGSTMCPTMVRYPFTDDESADIVAFLRGIPAVSRKITSTCPGHGE